MQTTFNEVRFSGKAKDLLAQLRSKQITLGDFLNECAYWALKDGWDELIPRPYPTPPHTQAFLEYQALPPVRRQKVAPEFFTKNFEINAYYEQKLRIDNVNRAALFWLKELKEYIPQEDYLSYQKIEARILEFSIWQEQGNAEVDRIKHIFDGQDVA